MQKHTFLRQILAGLILAATLVGCTAAPTALPTAIPTVDPKPTFDAIATQAVQTMAANLTLAAPPTATVAPPTETPPPLPTETTGPTNTPAPTITPTRVFIAWTQTPTATQPVYNCTVTSVSPDTVTINQDFDAKWGVKNSGSKTWTAGNTDIRYVEGQKMQQGGDVVDLTSDVAPNGTYTIVVDMKAPSSDGKYTTTWGIYLEDGSVCNLNMTINVTK